MSKVFVSTDARRPFPRGVIGSTVGAYPRGTGSNPVEGNGHLFPHTVSSTFCLSLTRFVRLSEGPCRCLASRSRRSQPFLACGAATMFILSRINSLSPCRHLLYTFRDFELPYQCSEQSCSCDPHSSDHSTANSKNGSVQAAVATSFPLQF